MIYLQKKLLSSFLYLIEFFQNENNIDCNEYLNKVKNIPHKKPIITEIFILYFWFLESITRKNFQLSKQILEKLIDLNDSTHKKISIKSINDYVFGEKIKDWIFNYPDDLPKISEKTFIDPISNEELELSKKNIIEIFDIIDSSIPDYSLSLMRNTRNILLCKSNVLTASTSPLFWGTMIIAFPDNQFEKDHLLEYFFDTIIHENAHNELSCLLAIDPIIFNDSEYKFISPLRSDKRPMLGLFHAFYVLSHVLYVGHKISYKINNNIIIDLLNERKKELLILHKTIKENCFFSYLGKKIFYRIEKSLNIQI